MFLLAVKCSPVFAAVKIGVIAPLTGDCTFLGEPIVNGVKVAVDEINRTIHNTNQRIQLEIEDDECSAASGVRAALKLASQDEVSMVIGSGTSNSTIPLANVLKDYKTMLIAPSAEHIELTEDGNDYVLRLGPRMDTFVRGAQNLLADIDWDSKVVIIGSPKYSEAASMIEKELSSMRGVNVEVLYEEMVSENGDSIARFVESKKANQVFLAAPPYQADSFLKSNYGRFSRNVELLFYQNRDLSKEERFAEIKRNIEKSNYKANDLAIRSYFAVMIWYNAYKKVGTSESERIIQLLKKDGVDTPIGSTKFEDNGDWSPAMAGAITSCGTNCPKKCSSTCKEKDGQKCCKKAGMDVPPIW
jgi:ABC-type branched-subunit amino acid transport system substrate-binding protein